MKLVNSLRQEDVDWLEANRLVFENHRRSMSKEQVAELFVILSWLTAKNQKPTGCGRCIASARDIVWATYKKQD